MKIWLAVFGFLLSTLCIADENTTINIGGYSIDPNSRLDINIEVPKGEKDPATIIPISVIHGSQKGPIIATVAGVHGYEYTSILAMEEWIKTLDPASMSGTVIAVRVAHVSAFEDRSIYVNPYDRKNLNRSFPGRADGTQTERVAWAISQDIVANADFLIDLHSGDGAEWLSPFIGVYGGPLASNYELALSVAKGFNFPNVVTYKMKSKEQVDRRRSLNRQGVASQIPTILVEIGENGSKVQEHVNAMKFGLSNALSLVGISSKKVETPNTTITYFGSTQSVPVKHAGLWFPKQVGGRVVKEGETLGVLKDYFGNTIEIVKAPSDGFGLYGLMGPAIKEGESVMTIAKPVAPISQ